MSPSSSTLSGTSTGCGLAADAACASRSVLETHLHNDYLTGGLELAGRPGRRTTSPAGDNVAYERIPAADGNVLEAGRMRLG